MLLVIDVEVLVVDIDGNAVNLTKLDLRLEYLSRI